MPAKLPCVCGQEFSSEGERARHRSYCDNYKRNEVTEKFVQPLHDETERLHKEADATVGALATAFDQFLDGKSTEAAYWIDVAHRQLEFLTDGPLRDLADKAAALSKDRYALTTRLNNNLKRLVERLQSYRATITKAQAYFRPRHA